MLEISRRDFLEGAVLVAGATSAGVLSGCTTEAATASSGDSNGIDWNYDADVVVIGSGCAGLPAAIKASEAGVSVLIVEGNFDCGGHFAVSGGQLHLGGGNSVQKKKGIEDSPDQWYLDHTTSQSVEGRWNEREVCRAVADNMVDTFESLLKWGVEIQDDWSNTGAKNNYTLNPPTIFTFADTVEREVHVDASGWDGINAPDDDKYSVAKQIGVGLTRPLEQTARSLGIRFLLNYHMDKIYREDGGDVIGVMASYTPTLVNDVPLTSLMSDGNIDESADTLNIQAHKAVILATGGGSGNPNWRTIFDPRWTEEYNNVGQPYGYKDGSGERAALGIGASLGCVGQAMVPFRANYSKQSIMGTWYNGSVLWSPDSVLAPLLGGTGIRPTNNLDIMQIRMDGKRFYKEDASMVTFEYADQVVAGILTKNEKGEQVRISTCVWSIFDQKLVDSAGWTIGAPFVDFDGGYAYKANSIEELAEKIVDPFHPEVKIDPTVLSDQLARYNSYVDSGSDDEFGKAMAGASRIENGPFYALWTNVCTHDCKTGLRINSDCQVLDLYKKPIPRLFAAGETASGIFAHGSAKCATEGYIAGMRAAALEIHS